MEEVPQVSTPHPSVEDTGMRTIKLERTKGLADQYFARVDSENLSPHTILVEKPIHTAIAYMMAAGRTRKEISESTGVGLARLSDLAQQPWFRLRLKDIADSSGKDLVRAFLEGEVLPSLEVLRTVRDNPSEKGATRVAACNSILDRFMGKPVAHIEAKTNLNIHTAADAADQVQHELERIDRELIDRGVKINSQRTN